jgi:predicted AAA+ superfamily ATPase
LDELLRDRKIEPADVKNAENLLETVWRGGLPGVVLASSDKVALERMGSYVDTYIQRDIQDLMKMRHPQNFRRLMTALAQATGWESVQEELSRVCGEKRSNVSRHMSLLKDTNLLYELKGYAGKGERSYRQSKYFWFDSGAACFLSGIHSPKDLKNPHLKGRYFENFILQEILAWGTLQVITPEVFYWRPRAGDIEVDFVIRSNGKVVGVEVKSAENITFGDTRAMREFLKFHPEASSGIIIYGGNKTYPIASSIYAVPWMAF